MNTAILIKTTPSRNPLYSRWNSLVQKCYNPNNKHYENYGGRGIRFDDVWSPSNPDGSRNFIRWLQEQLDKKPELRKLGFMLHRRNVNSNFGPGNCALGDKAAVTQIRTTGVLTFNMVVAMRKYKRANPAASLSQLQRVFDTKVSINNISRALRGTCWANVNVVEAPIPNSRIIKPE